MDDPGFQDRFPPELVLNEEEENRIDKMVDLFYRYLGLPMLEQYHRKTEDMETRRRKST